MLAKLRRLLARPWRQVSESDRHVQTMEDADRRIQEAEARVQQEAEARVRRLKWQSDVEGRHVRPEDRS